MSLFLFGFARFFYTTNKPLKNSIEKQDKKWILVEIILISKLRHNNHILIDTGRQAAHRVKSVLVFGALDRKKNYRHVMDVSDKYSILQAQLWFKRGLDYRHERRRDRPVILSG